MKQKRVMYRDTTNMEHEMYDYTSNDWSHQNSNKRFKERFGSHISKIFNTFTTTDSYTWDITHNMESIVKLVYDSLVKMLSHPRNQDKKAPKFSHLINITHCTFNISLHKKISCLRSNKS
jgi:hypothetical protein